MGERAKGVEVAPSMVGRGSRTDPNAAQGDLY